ncbi:MAG: D-sedoheptulose 7-phosphate isomerase [Deltaproteobacteria bacterium]|nr:D-sedoheptulose 7-phosphate isomerase [Deltaproteobacteria bacterium]MBM4347944.1 D-sedoheptulose 7-phosphate isomerase [Deltaproteobacteria bacterium]
MENIIQKRFKESIEVKTSFLKENLSKILDVIKLISHCFEVGNKLFFFGNGGSAADAQHLAAEFVNRYIMDRPPLPAIALTTDTSILTSISNDSSFNEVFAKQLRALGKEGDIAVGISTSGTSPNILKAFEVAKEMGMKTIALTGGDGGALAKVADYSLIVPSSSTPRIQEVHILVGHILCELVEHYLFLNNSAVYVGEGSR